MFSLYFNYHGSARLANQFLQALSTFRGANGGAKDVSITFLGCPLILLFPYKPNAYAKKIA